MTRRSAMALLFSGLLLTACGQSFPVYKGYKMSPYTLGGNRFVPMSIPQALRYKAEGVASHYEADGAIGAIGQKLHAGQLYACLLYTSDDADESLPTRRTRGCGARSIRFSKSGSSRGAIRPAAYHI